MINSDNDKRNSIAVICGDILHDKCYYSDHSINLLFDFIKMVSSIVPIIMIGGNHDVVYNMKRDGLKMLLDQFSNVYYLLESKYYIYNNIIFGHSSLFDAKIVCAEKIKTINKTKIALYHGIIKNSKINNNYMSSTGVNKGEFDGYDI